MKLKGKEKYFWEANFNIKNESSIPEEMDGITGIDSDHDDEFFFFLTNRVRRMRHIHLRCTFVTDEGVKHISKISNLRELSLKDHREVTGGCLPYINQLTELEYLDISKSNISVKDLYQLKALGKLKTLIISRDINDEEWEKEFPTLQQHFKGTEIRTT